MPWSLLASRLGTRVRDCQWHFWLPQFTLWLLLLGSEFIRSFKIWRTAQVFVFESLGAASSLFTFYRNFQSIFYREFIRRAVVLFHWGRQIGVCGLRIHLVGWIEHAICHWGHSCACGCRDLRDILFWVSLSEGKWVLTWVSCSATNYWSDASPISQSLLKRCFNWVFLVIHFVNLIKLSRYLFLMTIIFELWRLSPFFNFDTPAKFGMFTFIRKV